VNRIFPLLLVLPLLGGCIDLFESIWFNPVPLDAYEPWAHNDVPETHWELVALPGTAVEGEDEAPEIWGVWAHQCLDQTGPCDAGEPDCDCVTPDFPEFVAANQSRVIVYFHGNGGQLGGYWDRIQILWRMGFAVFAIDYRGFGRSSGEPSEAGIYADARTAATHVKERLVLHDPSLLGADDALPTASRAALTYYGFSLGSTAAIDLAIEDSPRAVITEGALAGAQAFLDDAAGIGLSSTVLMDTRFDNLTKIKSVLAPKLLTHGQADDFVRFEFSQLLFEAARDPKELYAVPLADHGNVPCPTRDDTVPSIEEPCIASAAWLERVQPFVDEHVP